MCSFQKLKKGGTIYVYKKPQKGSPVKVGETTALEVNQTQITAEFKAIPASSSMAISDNANGKALQDATMATQAGPPKTLLFTCID